MQKQEEQDVRPEDIEVLDKAGISNGEWSKFWENEMSKKTDGLSVNQARWRISRLSYLEGYQKGIAALFGEIDKIIKEYPKERELNDYEDIKKKFGVEV